MTPDEATRASDQDHGRHAEAITNFARGWPEVTGLSVRSWFDRLPMVVYRSVGAERAQLLSWPRPYRDNPYLFRLAEALAIEGVTTVSHRYLAALVARPGPANWLHLHWPEWMLRDSSSVRARARAKWLFALLDTARFRGIHLAWTAHNLIGHDEPHPDLAWQARRALLRRCEVVFGHFQSAERDLRALGFQGRFVHTPHPSYQDDYPEPTERTQALKELHYEPGVRILLAFGAIEPYKGLDRVATAFLRTSDARWRLHVAGPASSSEALRALIRAANHDKRIRIEARYIPAERVAVLFSAADALVLGYRRFYTSGSAMLALTLGTPVIGPPVNHLAELVGQPFFVPMPTPDALPAAMAAVESLDPSVRDAARAWARARTFRDMARTVADALFHRSHRSTEA